MTVALMRWLQRQHGPGRPWYRRYVWERCNRAVALQRTRPVCGELATTPLQAERQQMLIKRVRMR